MSVWAVVDGDSILSNSILCGEHANQPAVLSRVYDEVEQLHKIPRKLVGFEVLPDGDAALANDCVECKRLAPQLDLPPLVTSPYLPPRQTNQPAPEQPDVAEDECEEPVEYVHEKMDGVAPVPYGLELIDVESVWAEGKPATVPTEPMVELKLGVMETVWYPATAVVPRRDYDALLKVFPQLKRHALPLGLMMRLVESSGARVVVDESSGDVQGQEPVGAGSGRRDSWRSMKCGYRGR